jgi:hypothetical protein
MRSKDAGGLTSGSGSIRAVSVFAAAAATASLEGALDACGTEVVTVTDVDSDVTGF